MRERERVRERKRQRDRDRDRERDRERQRETERQREEREEERAKGLNFLLLWSLLPERKIFFHLFLSLLICFLITLVSFIFDSFGKPKKLALIVTNPRRHKTMRQ